MMLCNKYNIGLIYIGGQKERHIAEMKLYKYDTHVHTSEGSACADYSGREQARLYKKLGYDGIIITDHFYNGNTAVSRKLSWEQWVDGFMKGYEEALKEGKEIGLSVFFGWEESIKGMDFLIYGLGKEWLLKNREILYMDLQTHYRKIRESGGFVVHAHPFRNRRCIADLTPVAEQADAIEIMNGGNKEDLFNYLAAEYAKQWDKPVTGGSDAHHKRDKHGGIIVSAPFITVQDYMEVVEKKKVKEILPFSAN